MTSSRKRALRQSVPREIVVPQSLAVVGVEHKHVQQPLNFDDRPQQEYRNPKLTQTKIMQPINGVPMTTLTNDTPTPQKMSHAAATNGDGSRPPHDTDDDSSSITYYYDDINRQARKEEARVRRLQVQKRRDRKQERGRKSGVINWELIDQIDGLKRRFENEKSYIEFNFKY